MLFGLVRFLLTLYRAYEVNQHPFHSATRLFANLKHIIPYASPSPVMNIHNQMIATRFARPLRRLVNGQHVRLDGWRCIAQTYQYLAAYEQSQQRRQQWNIFNFLSSPALRVCASARACSNLSLAFKCHCWRCRCCCCCCWLFTIDKITYKIETNPMDHSKAIFDRSRIGHAKEHTTSQYSRSPQYTA